MTEEEQKVTWGLILYRLGLVVLTYWIFSLVAYGIAWLTGIQISYLATLYMVSLFLVVKMFFSFVSAANRILKEKDE